MLRRDFLKFGMTMSISSYFIGLSQYAFALNFPRLPLPPLIDTAHQQTPLKLMTQQGQSQFGAYPTTTWGYNGSLLGPAIRFFRGQPVHIVLDNQLDVETTVHWHGLDIPGAVDGGPQSVIGSGRQRRINFIVDQPAATCWFHPHQHGQTGYQVAMGLGGLALIEDQNSRQLPLPKTWGIDDIPLIVQDKKFKTNGQIDYQLDLMTAAIGWFGDTLLVNGVHYPQHIAPKGWLRLRLLNGCNARSLNFATSDQRPLYVIASDGGFLSEPVKVTQLPLLPGERFEVLVNTDNGKAFDLYTLPVSQMGMHFPPFDQPYPVLHIQPESQSGKGQLPDQLGVTMPAVPILSGLKRRQLKLAMNPALDALGMQALHQRYGHLSPTKHHDMSHSMHSDGQASAISKSFDFHHANTINDQAFNMTKPLFQVSKSQYEIWQISGKGDMMLHPFHVHGTQFRILSENGQPPLLHRSGWKDTVRVEGDVSEILVRFNHSAPRNYPYMAHCHLLEHEDTGMMASFTVE